MNLQDLLALPPGELNRRAAEAMGWEPMMPLSCAWRKSDDELVWMTKWNPETDYNDAARMRRECGHRLAFAKYLLRIVNGGSHSGMIGLHDLSKVANATPREITAAAVYTLQQGEQK